MHVQFQVTTLHEETPKGESPNGLMLVRGMHFDFIIEAESIIDAFTVGRARMMQELSKNGLQIVEGGE